METMEEQRMEKKMYCPIDKKECNFVETESPGGHRVCSCGYRCSDEKNKLINTQFGYKFEKI